MKAAFNQVKKMMFFFLVLSLSVGVSASQTKIDAEIDGYIKTFKGSDFRAQKNAIDELTYAGISDPRLWDVVEAELLSDYLSDNKYTVDRAAWLAKALATSGNGKYKATLQKVLESDAHRTIIKWAGKSLDRLDEYKVYNNIISSGLASTDVQNLGALRVKNMLGSDDYFLLTLAGKRLTYAHSSDTELLNLAHAQLMKLYPKVGNSSDEGENALSWLIRGLGASGDTKYISDLKTISKNSDSGKVRRWAKKVLKQYRA